MLIYLLPRDPHPRLYQTLNYQDAYDRVPLPAGWAAQLQCLHLDELDMPAGVHALDKATWLSAVVEELVIDLVSLTASCTLVNGPVFQWSLASPAQGQAQGAACIRALHEVLDDLTQSQLEFQREREKEQAEMAAAAAAAAARYESVKASNRQCDSLPQPVLLKSGKHKKQRSLLSHLISGFNKLSLNSSPSSLSPVPDVPSSPTNSSPSPTHPVFSPPPSPPAYSTLQPPRSPVSLSRPSNISWKPTVAFLPLTKKTPLPQLPPRPRSAQLEARARSRLLDTFRRFIISEVKTRLGFGGSANDRTGSVQNSKRDVASGYEFGFGYGGGYAYAPWIAHATLRRTEEHMAWLVQEAGGGVEPDLMLTKSLLPPQGRSSTRSDLSGSTLVSASEAPFYDDGEYVDDEDDYDEDGERSLVDSLSTETDGSSVHTPTDSPSASPFGAVPPPASVSRLAPATSRPSPSVPRSPTPPSQPEFSPEDLAIYTALSAQCLRLRELLSRMAAARADTAQEQRAFAAVLEIKSRRRAWSNRALLGGASVTGMGLAQPCTSSPLARCESVTLESLRAVGGDLEVATGEHNLSTLFPVGEEDEEQVWEKDVRRRKLEGDHVEKDEEEEIPAVSVRLVQQDAALRDMESGLLPPLQRPQARVRTFSMHAGRQTPSPQDSESVIGPAPVPIFAQQPLCVPTPVHTPAPVPVQAPLPTPAPTLLYQPLKKPVDVLEFEAQTKYELFDRPEHVQGDEVDAADEFTLAMDLPPPYEREGWVAGPGIQIAL